MFFLKKTFLGIAFSFLFIFNFYLIFIYSFSLKKESRERTILEEIYDFNKKSDEQFSFSSAPLVLGAATTEIKLSDGRTANLKSFFRKYNSPLYDIAEKIVAVSDKYGFDYRLLPAIAMQESNLCKLIPENSFNCWGYGIYGDQVLRFASFEEAIEIVAYGIKKNYIDKGLTTPIAVMSKYTPSSKGTWARAVTYFINQLE